jgi:hypothetical protein
MKNVKKRDLLNAAPEKIVQSETEVISFPLLPWSS